MNKKFEAYKLKFLAQLEDSDYNFIHQYPNLKTCVDVICLRDLISYKSKFKIFKLKGIDRLYIKADNRILVEYAIIQQENVSELFEITFNTYNEFERNIPPFWFTVMVLI